jgi:multiple sugar transport system substrate-binding protein
MRSPRTSTSRAVVGLALTLLAVIAAGALAACGGSNETAATSPSATAASPGGTSTTSPTPVVTVKPGGSISISNINVSDSMLEQFTAQTGVKVKLADASWEDFDRAAASHTYLVAVCDVDFSRVGLYQQMKWFLPLNRYFDPASLKSDVPMIDTFTSLGQLMAMPVDAVFLVTTWNKKIASAAGVTTTPKTLAEYLQAMKQIKAKGVLTQPLAIELDMPGWYQATAAFGGSLFDADWAPLFGSPDSAGYKALAWMVSVNKSGLVPNIEPGTLGGKEKVQGQVASVFADLAGALSPPWGYDGTVQSSVVGQVDYIPSPGLSGPVPCVGGYQADAIGIPVTARNKRAATAFIEFCTEAQNQAILSGLNDPLEAVQGMPNRWSSLRMLADSSQNRGARQLVGLLQETQFAFPGSTPPWYPQFEEAATTNIRRAVTGKQTVSQAIEHIAATVRSLKAE